MDVRSTRAHACQILNTVISVGSEISTYLVLPKYHPKIDFDLIKSNHDLSEIPKLIFLRNFGIRNLGIASFILFNIPAGLFLLRKKIKSEVDFLYFRSSYFVPLAILAFILRVPFFYEVHRRPISWSERCRDYIMSPLAAGIIVISSYMGKHYLPYKKKILVAHDAVSLNRFVSVVNKKEARENLDLDANQNICVYAGTVSKLKGIEFVIASARALPNVLFILVGNVSREFIKESLPPNVKLFGWVEQKKLPLILRSADALLLPHPKSEYSQSPMKLFEYMASGVPIVASRLPSISEILNDENAVLVEPEDGKALARGIERVIGDTHLSQTIAKKALCDVQNYTWEKRGITITEFIREVI